MNTKKISIIPVAIKKPYYCSENSLATLLGYYGKKISPNKLHIMGCYDFFTLKKCIPSSFKRDKGTLQKLKRSINYKHPILLSVIPDSNVKKNERHTILVYGYTTHSILIIDNGIKKNIRKKTLNRIWKRTNNDMWINKKVKK